MNKSWLLFFLKFDQKNIIDFLKDRFWVKLPIYPWFWLLFSIDALNISGNFQFWQMHQLGIFTYSYHKRYWCWKSTNLFFDFLSCPKIQRNPNNCKSLCSESKILYYTMLKVLDTKIVKWSAVTVTKLGPLGRDFRRRIFSTNRPLQPNRCTYILQ